MAIAHLCIQCGWDLARVRARREPHYGLPLIVCPRCQSACVRSVHPLWTGWKKLRRLDWALLVLAFKLAMAVALGALHGLTLFSIVYVFFLHSDRPALPDLSWIIFWCFLAFPLALGAWLTAGFNHLKRGHSWLAWTLFMMPVMLFLAVFLTLGSERSSGGFVPFVVVIESWRDMNEAMAGMFLMLYMIFVAFVATMIAATAGIPVGKGIIWLTDYGKRSMWRWRRSRRRRGRHA